MSPLSAANQIAQPHQSIKSVKDEIYEQQKSYVGALIDITVQLITSIWPTSTRQQPHKPIADLNTFLAHLLKQSRTTHSTLQLAIFYLFRIRSHVQKKQEEDVYISCGRRMFLGALISAHKYLQDKTYKNSAWSKLSGLSLNEVNHIEKVLLEFLDYRLHVKKDIYDQWIQMLQTHLKLNPPLILPQKVKSIVKKRDNTCFILAQQSLPSPPLENHKRKLPDFIDERATKKPC